MAESVKVIVRCRPMNSREKDLKCQITVSMDGKVGQCTIVNPNDKKAPPKQFTFDGAYFIDSTTEQIYADIAYPLVEGVTEGYNGTIFAYGQTGCGKSFSMQGIQDPATQRGIIPRAFDHIFETIQVSEASKYLVHASYLEIYNEEIRDLLGKDAKSKLDLKEHPDKGVYVQGLSLHMCRNTQDCEKVMEKGWKNRSVGSTLMNADSSRSHSIFTIHLERSDHDNNGEEHIRAAKLNLVDLAGSERQAKTGATGDRLKEATKINLSLSALGNVISALVDGKSKHIPYRDSKLTRLLQDSLGGNTKTLMVACLSPADNNYEETLSTLRYANRAKNIKNKPKINEDPKDAMLREFQEEIERLKAMLRGEIPVDVDANEGGKGKATKQTTNAKVVEKVVHVTNPEEIEREKKRLKEEYEESIQTMKAEFEEMKMSKQALQDEMTRLREHYEQEMTSIEDRVAGLPSPAQVGAAGTVSRSPRLITAADAEGPLYTDLYYEDDPESVGHGVASAELLEEGVEEEAPKRHQVARQAVHIGTVRQGDVPHAPRSSPTAMHESPQGQAEEALKREKTQDEALLRLQQLQQVMVGGEMANNEEIKEKRRKKKKHAEERRRKLAEEISKMEGDEVMFNVYENIQDEIKAKNKVIESLKNKNEALKTEIADVQSEFEFDRIDYLDTIRKQEKQMLLLQALIDKIHPCLRRDCNYTNLDRIKAQCEWDAENQRWMLPKMIIEKTKLPPAAGMMPGAREMSPQVGKMKTNGEVQPSIYDDLKYEDRFYEKLHNSSGQEMANNYFRNKRADKLLNQTPDTRGQTGREMSPNISTSSISGYSNGSPNSWGSGSSSPPSVGLRAAQVHGALNGEDLTAVRKPQRLESLPLSNSGKSRKKKKVNTMEQF